MKTSRARILVAGLVQGVGYRFFAQRRAVSLGLLGWVRNRPDNRVEVLVEGPKDRIESLIDFLRTGPSLSDVEDLDIAWEESRGDFPDFRITY